MRDNYEHLDKLVRVLEETLEPLTEADHKVKNGKGEYKFIPLSLQGFIAQVELALTLMTMRGVRALHFIDVGCGIGTKLALARFILGTGAKVTGLEITPEYVAVARKMGSTQVTSHYNAAPLISFEVIKGDARTHDYSPYNLIYFFCPMVDRAQQLILEKRIFSTAPKGAILLPNLMGSQREVLKTKWKPITINGITLYRKVRS